MATLPPFTTPPSVLQTPDKQTTAVTGVGDVNQDGFGYVVAIAFAPNPRFPLTRSADLANSWDREVCSKQMGSSKKPQPPSARQGTSFRALAILIPLIVVALSPVLVADFLRLDDHEHILDNPNLRNFSLSGLQAFWTKGYFGLYVPITYSVWWVFAGIAQWFGTLRHSASLFHALNLALHVVNASLLFSILQTLLRLDRTQSPALSDSQTRVVSLLSALFFALHPAQVETVAWISEFKGGLSGVFGLLGIWSYYRSPRKALAAACFIAAMLSKPSAVVFPGILLLVDRILLGKSLRDSASAPLFFGMLLLPFVLITKQLQPDVNLEFVPSLIERLGVASDAFAFYCRILLFPFRLTLDYGRSPHFVLVQVPGWQMALSIVLAVVGLAVVGYSLFRPRQSAQHDGSIWRSFVLCGWAVFCLSLAPVLGLVPFSFQDTSTVADRYLYVPMFGASIAVVGLLIRTRATVRSLRVAGAILAVLAGLSFYQARIWWSTETLFRHTFAINPRSYVGHYSIAAELFDAGRTDEGIEQTRKCLAINPDYLSAEVALGIAWLRKGEFQNAIDYYGSVLAKNRSTLGKRAPFIATIHNNLGMLLHRVGRKTEGTQQFVEAVEVDPTSVDGHMNLGHAALNEGRFADAANHYQAALALSPGNPAVQRWLDLARRGGRM